MSRWMPARTRFNPRPASSARRTRLFMRCKSVASRFNPRPASSARRTRAARPRPGGRRCFNPRPASSARRTSYLASHGSRVTVSTHAPLRQRGELSPITAKVGFRSFQPTPRFVSEANVNQAHGERGANAVSTHAPLRQRGEQAIHDGPGRDVAVSTHAPLRQRGEPAIKAISVAAEAFQPTPRFVSEANVRGENTGRFELGFNPRPASSARRTRWILA